MSDMRYIIASVLLVFLGFLILGLFGHEYQAANIESSEFGDCFEYSDNKEPAEINCSNKLLDQILFFGLVFTSIGGGLVCLLKGIKGKWDNEVKPEDMVGPSDRQNKKKD